MRIELRFDRDEQLIAAGHLHGAGMRIGNETMAVCADTPEQMRDILNDYCRANIDAKNIEAGQPLWVENAQRCSHEWVYDPFEDMDVCQRCNLQVTRAIVNDPTRNVADKAQERRP